MSSSRGLVFAFESGCLQLPNMAAKKAAPPKELS